MRKRRVLFVFLPAIVIFLLSAVRGGEQAIPGGEDIAALFARATDLKIHDRTREAARRMLVYRMDAAREFLHSTLQSGDSHKRQVAAMLLGRGGGPGDEGVLLEALGSGDPFVVNHAESALADLYSRMEVAARLHRAGADAGADALSNLRGRHLDTVRAAVLASFSMKPYSAAGGESPPARLPPSAATFATGFLPAENRILRYYACRALACAKPSAALFAGLLKRLREDPEPLVRAEAVRSLAALGGDGKTAAAIRPVFEADSTAPAVRLEAAAWLARHRGRDALDAIHRTLEDQEAGPSLRLRAAAILEDLANPFSEGPLARTLSAKSEENPLFGLGPARRLRIAAARALGTLQGQGITAALRECIDRGDPLLMAEASIALHGQGALGIHWRLVAFLDDRDPWVRTQAARALGALGEAAAIPKLRVLLRDKDLDAACTAARALGCMPRERDAALAALEYGEKEKRFAVRLVCAEARAVLLGGEIFGSPAPSPDAWRARLARPGAY